MLLEEMKPYYKAEDKWNFFIKFVNSNTLSLFINLLSSKL
jgi:hypothetical protein